MAAFRFTADPRNFWEVRSPAFRYHASVATNRSMRLNCSRFDAGFETRRIRMAGMDVEPNREPPHESFVRHLQNYPECNPADAEALELSGWTLVSSQESRELICKLRRFLERQELPGAADNYQIGLCRRLVLGTKGKTSGSTN